MDASNLLIVIPARGGSKGLPGKNARSLGQYPLLQWTSDAIDLSGLENYQCVLSTDDDEIAAIGKRIGLDVPFTRPTELANDTASAVDVIKHALEWFRRERNFHAECLMLLQPTSPFRPPHIIRDAYSMLQENATDAVIGVKPIHRNLSTLFYADENQNMTPVDENEKLITRRQDVRTLLTPNGAMYAIKSNILESQNTLFPTDSKGIRLDQIQSHDIDDHMDWTIATSYVNAELSWRSSN
jgi:CMP-N,N'-diacetyllegionaminic acid synthase